MILNEISRYFVDDNSSGSKSRSIISSMAALKTSVESTFASSPINRPVGSKTVSYLFIGFGCKTYYHILILVLSPFLFKDEIGENS